MGVDKATLTIAGKPMIVSVADAMWEAGCHPVECQGGDADAIAEFGLEVMPDDVPGFGPLPAISAALSRHAGSDVVVAACDLPDLDGATIRSLIAAGTADRADADVVVATTGQARHLVAWWRRGVGPRLDALVASGVTSYRAALDVLDTLDVQVATTAVRNVNAPADTGTSG
jgi:molybdopterin-guanine dinucleotide biosynthesis protein A